MSGTSASVVVNHLINNLTDITDNDGAGNKEEREEPLSPQESVKDLEDVEQRRIQDVSTRLSDYRQRKRTTITHSQKAILEEFYASGMTSSGMQFSALHHAAAQKTGLSVHNIQHWIRNRRRPVCKEKTSPMMNNHRPLDGSFTTIACAISPNDSIVATNSPLYLIDSSTDHIKNYYQSSETISVSSQLAAVIETAPAAILVKCRIANSIEEDFVEVEVPSLTYEALLQSCCDELEVESTVVAKIRKLPNTLVRKDKDVMRLNTLQELELVLHTLTP